MRNTLLISTAIVGLVAGVQLASAQAPAGQSPGQKMEQPSGPDSGKPQPAQKASPNAGKEGAAAPSAAKEGAKDAKEGAKEPSTKTGAATDKEPSTKTGAATDKDKDGAAPKRDHGPSTAQSQTPGQRSEQPTGPDSGRNQPGMGDRNQPGASGRPSTAQQPSQDKMGQSSTTNTNVNVNLNPEQRTKIRETVIRRSDAPRLSKSNINFNLSVGTTVPRSVHVATLPAEVIEIHPAWRGFMYFLVGDEIVVVEPGSLRIVAVLPA
jgi:hypothetical protein